LRSRRKSKVSALVGRRCVVTRRWWASSRRPAARVSSERLKRRSAMVGSQRPPDRSCRGEQSIPRERQRPAGWAVRRVAGKAGRRLVVCLFACRGDPAAVLLWSASPRAMASLRRRLVQNLGGKLQILKAEDPRGRRALVRLPPARHPDPVGESLRSRWQELLRGSFVTRLIQKASNIDIHGIARRER
jgi:hypothetical protein